jgi:uncharacterized protein YjbI with pentapeptide repeats
MWEIITKIGTPISLVAFIFAIIFKYLKAKTSSKINLIKLAPEETRTSLIEAALETYNLKDDNLTKEQKYDLIKTVLRDKAKRFNVSAIIFLLITIIILILSALVAPKLINKPLDSKNGKTEIKNRISNIVENFNYNDIERSKAYFAQVKNLLKSDDSKEIREFTFDKLKSFYKSQTESAGFGFKSDDITNPIRELRSSILQLMVEISDNKMNILLAPNDLEYIDLAHSDLSNKNLSGLSFKGCFLLYTNFENANLEDCNFNDSFLRLVNFKNSKLKNASFKNADWYNASNIEFKQFSEIDKKSIEYLAPTSVDSLIKELNNEYAFPFSNYPSQHKELLTTNWKIYLKKGGLIETANSW